MRSCTSPTTSLPWPEGVPGPPAAPVILPRLAQAPSLNRSPRLQPVRMVVVHRPAGSYRGAIEALRDPHPDHPERRVSAHVLVREDGREATQLVPWNLKAWSCAAFNSLSDNIETPDAIWSKPLTGANLHAFLVCARIVAFRLHQRGFPAVWLRGETLLHGRGFTRHLDLGAAGGNHSDPTSDTARWRSFVAAVETQHRRGGFRRTWGTGDDL